MPGRHGDRVGVRVGVGVSVGWWRPAIVARGIFQRSGIVSQWTLGFKRKRTTGRRLEEGGGMWGG